MKEMSLMLIASLPVFFSGIIFLRIFTSVADRGNALAINLFGAMVGGILSSLSLLIGMRMMMAVVVGLYLAAAIASPKMPRRSHA